MAVTIRSTDGLSANFHVMPWIPAFAGMTKLGLVKLAKLAQSSRNLQHVSPRRVTPSLHSCNVGFTLSESELEIAIRPEAVRARNQPSSIFLKATKDTNSDAATVSFVSLARLLPVSGETLV